MKPVKTKISALTQFFQNHVTHRPFSPALHLDIHITHVLLKTTEKQGNDVSSVDFNGTGSNIDSGLSGMQHAQHFMLKLDCCNT